MPANSLYPGFIKLFYEGNSHVHVQVLPVFAITPNGASYDLTLANNDEVDWIAALATYTTVAKAFLATADGFLSAQLWSMSSPTADPVFLADTAAVVAGTSGNPAQAFSQAVLTFRTNGGGLYRWYIMEQAAFAINSIVNPPFGGAIGTFVTYMLGNTNFIIGRDGQRLSSAIRLLTKYNDALRKKYLLNV